MDKDELSGEFKDSIRVFLSSLDTSESQQILQIRGYTDFVGNSEYNKDLSLRRCQHVLDLIQQDPKAYFDSIYLMGLGELDSTVSGDLSLGILEHRMVEISVIQVQKEGVIVQLEKDRLRGLGNLNRDSLHIGQQIILEDLNFHPGRHILLPEAIPKLKELLKTLTEIPNLHIQIQGHICCGVEGEPDAYDLDTGEQRLSVNRAKNIYEYLVRKGIARERLSYRGYGYRRPLFYPEQNAEEEKKNRRVELLITKL
jgi:outer membrane protein OmpA-like peptidoglycan-associated protein